MGKPEKIKRDHKFKIGQEVCLTGRIEEFKGTHYIRVSVYDGVCGMRIVDVTVHNAAIKSERDSRKGKG